MLLCHAIVSLQLCCAIGLLACLTAFQLAFLALREPFHSCVRSSNAAVSASGVGIVPMQTQDPQNTEVLKVCMSGEHSVQSMLGIKGGGADALAALSLLCGGDYAIKGAEHVGSRAAVNLVQHLLQGCEVRHCVLTLWRHAIKMSSHY